MKALRSLLREVLSLPSGAVRPSYQAGPTGAEPCVIVSVLTSVEIGTTRQEFDGAREIERLSTARLTIVSVEAFGNNAYALMQTLMTLLQASSTQAMMRNRLNAGLVTLSPLRDLTTIVGAGTEERAQFDATFSHSDCVEIDLNRIEHARFTTHTETHEIASAPLA
ncbi:Uncharacterized protein MCB1EB_0421 [Mycoavidus cysteinexigens]|uniref:Phage neck terminator protein gp12-like domain-containing protein n=2 Tax=Mycoavidus cysteinexigens TaxID=1553431 RepID=A0A2Z6ET80_9BURK|nr:hypothetical protein [Mycoavidus cysteinexigens]BBE08582.1 Uncharacterized protein MCB1EB_0421 [Mycoavidus cysteinexigens]GAM52714.1 hypothetical protein EBME_1177 [bacterium endosymbiont of Mortierella elongata FMR23-6]GLR02366.1 hypothetical protein GCM10007934_21830 [Mycoavidus cysteinexigens]